MSPNAKNIAAPDTEDTPVAPFEENLQIPIPSPGVASDRESIAAIDDRIFVPQTSTVEQEGESLDRNSKRKQNVLTEPANREYDRDQKEQFAKRNVHQILEHHLRECEKVRTAICVDRNDCKGSRRVCETCYDSAVARAHEIETTLSKNGNSLHGFPYVVERRRGTKTPGYRGSDMDRIKDPIAITSESPSDYPAQRFSSTPYWTRESTMVEIFCGDDRDRNITGALIRMQSKRADGSSTMSVWTCGGIIKVDGTNYGLTTVHLLMPRSSLRPVNEMAKDLTVNNGPFGDKYDFLSEEKHPEKYWQAIGKVSYYALARMESIPSNNDWLLFELPKGRSMWNA